MQNNKTNLPDEMLTMVPWKIIVRFSLPLLAGNLFQQMYSMADAVIIGRLVGVKELAGVGATSAMNFLVLGFAMGAAGGFSILTAQQFGAGNEEGVKKSVAMSMMLCAGLSVMLSLLGALTAEPLLRIMNTPEDIFPYARIYILVIYLGIGATVYYNMISGVLRALGDSRTSLYFLILSSVMNIILDLLVILVLNMGIMGAALATVISQLVSAVCCHIYALRRYPLIRLKRRHFRFAWSEAVHHIKIGIPMAIQFSVTAVGIMILQAYLNVFGSSVVAGYTAAGKVEALVTQPFSTLEITMETYCGQNYGAGNKERVKRGIKSGLIICMITVAIASSVCILFGRSFISLFLKEYDPDIVNFGQRYLLIVSVFFWLLGVLHVIRSSLQGIGEALVPMMGGVVELAARWAGCAAMAGVLGYTGIYLSTPLAWGSAVLLLLARYAVIFRREEREKTWQRDWIEESPTKI